MEDAHSFVYDYGAVRGQGYFAVFEWVLQSKCKRQGADGSLVDMRENMLPSGVGRTFTKSVLLNERNRSS
jgi:hypothetical protein